MMQIVVPLLLVNAVVILALGLIRQENPLEVWLLCLVAAANVVFFLAAAILAADNAIDALTALVTNVLPFLAVAAGVVAMFAVLAMSGRKQRS